MTEESTSDPASESDTNKPVLRMACDKAYAIVGETAIGISAQFSGGTSPYSLTCTIAQGEEIALQETVSYEDSGTFACDFDPAAAGSYTVRIRLTDHTGTEALLEHIILAADRVTETDEIWSQSVSGAVLTGIWAQDLVSIAQTQMGYCPSSTNFIVERDGRIRPYTRYADRYGTPYSPWSAMFVAFCLDYANIPQTAIPRNPICQDWMEALSDMGIFRQHNYIPTTGDIVFFGQDGVSNHVGIVCATNHNQITTLEGDRTGDVREFCYELTDTGILGFASLGQAFRQQFSYQAIKLYEGDDTDLIPSDKMAVVVSLSGITGGAKLSYDDGTTQTEFLYNSAISEKTGCSAYVAMVPTAIPMDNLENRNHYTLDWEKAAEIYFGDYNQDGIINAQEALDVVDVWLRKGQALTDTDILTMNINCDGKINTFDILGIVETFVNGTEYSVVSTAVKQLSEPGINGEFYEEIEQSQNADLYSRDCHAADGDPDPVSVF